MSPVSCVILLLCLRASESTLNFNKNSKQLIRRSSFLACDTMTGTLMLFTCFMGMVYRDGGHCAKGIHVLRSK